MKKHPITGCRVESLFGYWFIEPSAHESLVEQAKGFDLNEIAKLNAAARAAGTLAELPEENEGEHDEPDPESEETEKLPYALTGGVAVIDIMGPTTKYPHSYQLVLGGTSTLLATAAMRHAVRNEDVKSILLHFQSPGGTTDGAFDFVDAIRRADAIKPVYGHASDQCTSASMLFSSQCRRVTANRNAWLGSIGVRTELVDSSQGYKAMGVRRIPIASGRFKTVGAEGTPVTKADEAYVKGLVDEMNRLFIADVSAARRVTTRFLLALEARVFGAAEAQSLNLIDGISNFEDALKSLKNTSAHPPARGVERMAV